MASTRKIYDPLHGFIAFTPLEGMLIDSLPFQRLHYIHQLGPAYLVYPGGVHKRFEHSLGVMELATQVYEEVIKRAWENDSFGGEKLELPAIHSEEYIYWKGILRFAALCHDLGHLPFSHTAEKALLADKGGHEYWTLQMIYSSHLEQVWESFAKEMRTLGIERDIPLDVAKIATGEKGMREFPSPWKEVEFSSWERIVTEIITGDFFGADRIDYLLRDAKCTGVTHGLFDYQQLIATLRILPKEGEGYTLGIEENGIDACESLLLGRHFMHRRIYQHPSVKSYSFHFSRFMESMLGSRDLSDMEAYLRLSDNEILTELSRSFYEEEHPGHLEAKAIFQRKKRFKALPVSKDFSREDLELLCQEAGMNEEEFSIAFKKKKEKKGLFDFPVITARGELLRGEALSGITLPPTDQNWIFIPRRYQRLWEEALERHTAGELETTSSLPSVGKIGGSR